MVYLGARFTDFELVAYLLSRIPESKPIYYEIRSRVLAKNPNNNPSVEHNYYVHTTINNAFISTFFKSPELIRASPYYVTHSYPHYFIGYNLQNPDYRSIEYYTKIMQEDPIFRGKEIELFRL